MQNVALQSGLITLFFLFSCEQNVGEYRMQFRQQIDSKQSVWKLLFMIIIKKIILDDNYSAQEYINDFSVFIPLYMPKLPRCPTTQTIAFIKKKLLCTLPYTYYHITEKFEKTYMKYYKQKLWILTMQCLLELFIWMEATYLIEELLPKYLVMLPLKTPLKITIILSRKQDLEYIKIKGNEPE